MKKVWITSLHHNENSVKNLMTVLRTYHIPVDGGFWVDDLPKMAWAGTKEFLIDPEVGLWVIMTDKSSWENKAVLRGLSALAIMVQTKRKTLLPTLILHENFSLEQVMLPTSLVNARVLPLTSSSLGAKVSAMLNTPFSGNKADYYIDFHPLNELGLWLEVGPYNEGWPGVILGVNNGEINFQAVGSRGTLPEKCVLEYAQQGLEIAHSSGKFTAWGVQNSIDVNTSYFVRISEIPEKLLFTSYTQSDETEAYILRFC